MAIDFGEFLSSYDRYKTAAQTFASVVNSEPTLSTFANILIMAREQFQESRTEVAFVLGCTALECLMVGKDDPIARTLSRRIAGLYSLSHDVPFRDAARDIQKLYDTRSQFAHKGKPISAEELDRLLGLCAFMFPAAGLANLRWRSNATEAKKETSEMNWLRKWHKVLDYVSSALEANITVDDTAAMAAGFDGTARTALWQPKKA